MVLLLGAMQILIVICKVSAELSTFEFKILTPHQGDLESIQDLVILQICQYLVYVRPISRLARYLNLIA